jgi:hypothetical protein
MLLKANTAVDVLIGPFIDETDGKTAETGLTISQADVRLSKNGQNMAQKDDNTAAAHDELGYHNCELNATDTNTEGQLLLAVHEAGALPVWHEFNVISEAAWDSLFAAKDVGFMDVNVKTVGRADAQETEATNLEAACAAYDANRGLSGNALPGAAADAGGGLPISDDGGFDFDELYDAIVTDATGANVAIDIIALKAETVDILADTGELQTDDIPTSIAALPTAVEIQAEMEANGTSILDALRDGLTDQRMTNLDELGSANLPADIDLILADTGELQVDDIPTLIAALPTAVEIQAEMEANGASLLDTIVDKLPTNYIMGSSDQANHDTDIDLILADTDELQADDIPGAITGLNDIAAADVLDATEAITGDTHSLETMVTRIYMFLFHEMNITDISGDVVVRNSADDGDVMTHTITDDDTTTDRTKTNMSP